MKRRIPAFLLAVLMLIKKDNGPKKTLQGFDFMGAVCVLLFFSMVLCIPTFGQQSGWFGTPTVVCYAVALISGLALVATEKKAQNRAYEILKQDYKVTDDELSALKELFHLYNIQYVNDIILSSLELLYNILQIAIAIKGNGSSK